MKHNFLIYLFLICFGLQAQQKGAKPILATRDSRLETQTTYAVVVGISDYQEKEIPDLRYADKDAEAFANFLRSNAGGRLDNDHLKVLINEQATMAQFAINLDWLLENAKENDRVIIYFSGHGDVEKKTLTQPGFLLCWDAPEQVYMSGGAFALPMLQEVVSTLSIQNKAQVVIITDACRSGKLSGSSINGNQLTNANLAKQYANEIKILSCQPHEYSIEGEQWGGGRGAFSYNLVNALYGLADNNNDLIVNLQEVGRYLEDHVTAEVAPVSQVPMIIGNRTTPLSKVNTGILASLRQGRFNQVTQLSSIDSRGIVEEVLTGVDTNARLTYRLFNEAIKNKNFLIPEGSCAETYYQKLISNQSFKSLHTTFTRNYAAALQDDAQQTLNEWMKNSQDKEFSKANNRRLPLKVFTDKIRSYPLCLDRASELLGEKHYMYSTLKARKYFFEGYLITNSDLNPNPILGKQALNLFRKSLDWQPEQPHVFWQISRVFGIRFLEPDSTEYYAKQATLLNPNWVIPLVDAAFMLSDRFKIFQPAEALLQQATKIDSSLGELWNAWGTFYYRQKKYLEAEAFYLKFLSYDSINIGAWNNLGMCYFVIKKFYDAEMAFKKAISLDSTNVIPYNNLGICYNESNRHVDAELAYKKAITVDSNYTITWRNLSKFYYNVGRYADAALTVKKAISLDSTNSDCWTILGSSYYMIERYNEAELAYKKALTLDSTNVFTWQHISNLYYSTRHYLEAEAATKKAITLDSTNYTSYLNYGWVCIKMYKFKEAQTQFLKAKQLNPEDYWSSLGIACIFQSEGKITESIDFVEQAIDKGIKFEELEKAEELSTLRSTPEYKQLMKKHFPEQFKD